MIVREVVADLYGCDEKLLDNPEELLKICQKGAEDVGATVLNKLVHHYEPQGVSIILILAESHIYLATWPEYGFVTVNIFLCNELMDPYVALKTVCDSLNAKDKVEYAVAHKIGPMK